MRRTLFRNRKSKLRTSHNIPSSEIQPEIPLCEEYKDDVDPVPKKGLGLVEEMPAMHYRECWTWASQRQGRTVRAGMRRGASQGGGDSLLS